MHLHKPLLFLLIGSQLACSTSLVGEWVGECEFEDTNMKEIMDIEANVTRDNGYILEGQMTIVNWDEEQFVSDLDGDHTGKYVLMKSDFETQLGMYRLRLETERVGRHLEGDCSVRHPDAPGALTGSVHLEK
jgi:hypothetical protein